MDVKRDEYGRPRVFLEGDNVPVAELGVECQREGGAGLHPPVNRLHVWWARRPLTVSRAAILGSLLPEGYDRTEFLELIGIPRGKDPVKAKKIIDEVKAGLRKRVKDPYGYDRAFKHNLTQSQQNKTMSIYKEIWQNDKLTILDSFAGGGSIPFEAHRLGLNTISNELNPVASIIERATIDYPSLFGKELAKEIEKWGKKIEETISEELSECFPRNPEEKDLFYIWIRTVKCPQCELIVPLSPNNWLDKKNELGYKLILPKEGNICGFEVRKKSEDFDPKDGTVSGGKGKCPRCPERIEGKEIKDQAKAGSMGHQLAIVGYKIKGKRGRHFREVTEMDLEGYRTAEKILQERILGWRARGLVPDEVRSINYRMDTVYQYGVDKWYEVFNERQLLVHLTTIETILNQPWHEIKNEKKRESIRVYIQMTMGKTLNYNSSYNIYDPNNVAVKNVFARHDFSISWTYGEIDGAGQLFKWGIEQIVDAYRNLVLLLNNSKGDIIYQVRDAANLFGIDEKTVDTIIIDPPYYDNVMYADLSDFFYVWMKRGIGDLFPELFSSELTNKDDEAVANYSRFLDAGRGNARKLSVKDYEAKMAAAFREMHRVLRDDGVMTVMFTHKKPEAWDALARGLLDSDFEITAAWPVHTEGEYALNQAKKNAAKSTILLTCRKRPDRAPSGWWEELRPILEERVKEQAEVFERNGIKRLDLSIACFGTALEVISEKWPVKRGDGTIISPEEALDAARSVVSQWFMDKITYGERKAVDPATQFYILAWYVFQAREFPFDEARKLSLSVGFSTENLKQRDVLKKKGDYVEMLTPKERARAGGLKAGAKKYRWDLDYVQAAILSYEAEGAKGVTRFHKNSDAMERPGYRNAVSYLLDVLPRKETVPEYQALNNMWESSYRDSVSRKRPVSDPTKTQQKTLF